MEDQKEAKIYELAYLISPLVAEERLVDEVGELRKNIEEKSGLILSEEPAKMRKLAYTIRKPGKGKFDSAYFGWFKFIISPDMIDSVKEAFDRIENVLRYLIVETIKEEPPKRKRTFIPVKPPVVQEPKEEIKEEEIDKKLEELIGEEKI